MQTLLSATPLGPAILRWNYAGYQVLARQGPHGGLWNSAAAALAEWGIFSLAFVLVALLFFGRTPERARLDALAAAAAAAVALQVNHLLGNLWYEPRPYLSHYHVPLLAAAAHGNSFPSDHLAFGGAVVGALWVTRRRWLALASLLVMAGVGWARVVTGIHWPFDVLVGLALGLLVGAAVGAVALHLGRLGRLLALLPLPRWLAVPGAVVVVVVGFAVLEKATHLGIVVGPIVIGAVLMAALGLAWPRRRAQAIPGELPERAL
ncbi:MAG: phosphatase PAP2 family protein [Candidatus Dormibacteria bacterium]